MDHPQDGLFMIAPVFKFVTAKAAGLVALPLAGFIATDYLTGNVGLGAAIAALCSCITAIFVTRPKVIAAKAAAMVAQTSSADQHIGLVVQRMNDIHKTEIDFWKERVARHEKADILIRATKHKLINCYTAAVLRIKDMEEVLKENGIPQVGGKYVFTPILEITGEEDRKMIESIFSDQLK